MAGKNTRKNLATKKRTVASVAISAASAAVVMATVSGLASTMNGGSSALTVAHASQISQGEHVSAGSSNGGGIDMNQYPHIQRLHDNACEGVMFPTINNTHLHRPYFLMLYSPTCLHCQQLMPHFNEVALETMYRRVAFGTYDAELGRTNVPLRPAATANPHSPQFAAVNMAENPRLRDVFPSKSLPVFVYTIGGHAYPYQGSVSAEGFMRMAALLTDAHRYNNPQMDPILVAEANNAANKANATATTTTATAPLSIPIPDITTKDRFTPYWNVVTGEHHFLNPMGTTAGGTQTVQDPVTNATKTVSSASRGGINVGIAPPLFVVCQPPNSDATYKVGRDQISAETASIRDGAVRRPAFATFVESIMTAGRSRFATMQVTKEDIAKVGAKGNNAAQAATDGDYSDEAFIARQKAEGKFPNERLLSSFNQNPDSVFDTLKEACVAAFSPSTTRKPSQGPNGEVLLLYSTDRAMKPIYYHGYKDGINKNMPSRKTWAGDGVSEPTESVVTIQTVDEAAVKRKEALIKEAKAKRAEEKRLAREGGVSSDIDDDEDDDEEDEAEIVKSIEEEDSNIASIITTKNVTIPITVLNNKNEYDDVLMKTRLEPLTSVIDASTFRTSKAAAMWVWENSYNLVEFGSNDVIGQLPKRMQLGVFVVDKPLGKAVNSKDDLMRVILGPDPVLDEAAEAELKRAEMRLKEETRRRKEEERDKMLRDKARLKEARRTRQFVNGEEQAAKDEPDEEEEDEPEEEEEVVAKARSQSFFNISHYYPGLNWLSRKRFLAWRTKHRLSLESSVLADTMQKENQWPYNAPGMKTVSMSQTDFESAAWAVRWQTVAPMQLAVISAVDHADWLRRLGVSAPAAAIAAAEAEQARRKAVKAAAAAAKGGNRKKKTTDDDDDDDDTVAHSAPYFFAIDAINNKVATMDEWLVDSKKGIFGEADDEAKALSAAACAAAGINPDDTVAVEKYKSKSVAETLRKRKEKLAAEKKRAAAEAKAAKAAEAKANADKNTPASPFGGNTDEDAAESTATKIIEETVESRVHTLPVNFEPRTGIALHLMDQFMSEFMGDVATERNDNVDGATPKATTHTKDGKTATVDDYFYTFTQKREVIETTEDAAAAEKLKKKAADTKLAEEKAKAKSIEEEASQAAKIAVDAQIISDL